MSSDAFLTARFIFSRCREGRKRRWGGKRETWPYYIFVEAADDTLMNSDHSRSVIYTHTKNHTIYADRLIAPLLFPTTTLCSYFQCMHIHIASPDVLSSSLLWAELSHSHRHQPLSKGSWSWEKYGPDENGKRHVRVNLLLKENNGHKVPEWTDTVAS